MFAISLASDMRKSGDPFEVDPLPRSFYYPSQQKVLPEEQRKICLSPNHRKEDTAKSPADEKFLRQTDHMKIHEIPTRENGTKDPDNSSSSKFDESWLSSERVMVSTPEADAESSGLSKTPSSEGTEIPLRPLPDSTLARYIHRFRHAPPSSRQARDHSYFDSGKAGEFWWLSPSPPSSSTPKEGTPPDQLLGPSPRPCLSPKLKRNATKRSTSPSSPVLKTRSVLSPSKSSLEGLDAKTADLQQRARTLLEKSESTLESSSSEAQRPKRVTQHGPPKERTPREAPFLHASSRPLTELQQRQCQLRPAPPPEDDILYQWRLARKMERAHEQVAKLGLGRNAIPSTQLHALSSASTILPITQTPLVVPQRDVPYQATALHRPTPAGSVQSSSLSTETQTTSSTPTAVVSGRQEIPSRMVSSHLETASQVPTSSNQSQMPVEQSRETQHIIPSTGQVTTEPTVPPVGPQSVQGPLLVEQAKFEPAGVPSHMHLSCDILPCPHQRALIENGVTDKVPLSAPVVELMMGKVHMEERQTDNSTKPRGSEARELLFDKKLKPRTRQNESEEARGDKGLLVKEKPVCLTEKREKEKPKIKEDGRRKPKARLKVPQGAGPNDLLSGVIGEVVSERLFSTPRSSTTSLAGSEESVGAGEPKAQHPGHASDQENTSPDVSSDKEFSDDEVLKMLRQRARRYREQLRQIDSILNQQNPRPTS